MIYVVATIQVGKGKREQFLAEFHKLVPKVHAEEGCLEYGPMIDADTDIAAAEGMRDDTVVVLEKWSSLSSLKAHLGAPHMLEFREQAKSLITGRRLEILTPA